MLNNKHTENMRNVTTLEKEILVKILNSEHAAEGFGLCGYIYHEDNDMKKTRGALSSLIKKGVIGIDKHSDLYKNSTWCFVEPEFQVKNLKSTLNYSYKNINL